MRVKNGSGLFNILLLMHYFIHHSLVMMKGKEVELCKGSMFSLTSVIYLVFHSQVIELSHTT